MNRSTIIIAAAVASAGLVLTGCSSDGDDSAASEATTAPSTSAPADQTIVDLAVATPDLSTLVSVVQAAELDTTLAGTGPFTVFAPTNEAFAALPKTVTDALVLPCNKDALTKVLTYHVVPGAVTAADITPGDVATVEGQNVTLAVDPVTVNGVVVSQADVVASNGVVHVIDGVLLPPGLDVDMLKTSC
jgi:uncharacterized surface protein with fasciclin (FAS1) repeats